ncbi:MAG: hypothetical protein AMXMBFR82_05790 [Candidatus Hydrogenedentota bacterium]
MLVTEQVPEESKKPELVEAKPVSKPETESEGPDITRIIVRTRAAAPWAIAAVLITAIVVVGFLVYSVTYRLPREAATVAVDTVEKTVNRMSELPTGIAAAFKPNVNVNTTIHRAVDDLKQEAKLVVMTAGVDVEVQKTSEKAILWDYLQLGDTSVRLRAQDNKVQYYIPVAELSRDNFEYDAEAGAVCLHLPEPVLDTDFVDVQSNPDLYQVQTEVGWGRLEMYSGRYLEDEARRTLRGTVLEEGDSELLRERARKEAEQVVTAMLSNLVSGLREDVAFRVEFDVAPSETTSVWVNG